MLLHWEDSAKWWFFTSLSSFQIFTVYWNPILWFQMLLNRFWAKHANALISIRKKYYLHIIISFMIHPNLDHLPSLALIDKHHWYNDTQIWFHLKLKEWYIRFLEVFSGKMLMFWYLGEWKKWSSQTKLYRLIYFHLFLSIKIKRSEVLLLNWSLSILLLP